MKIDELVGYKQKPEFQAVKDSPVMASLQRKFDDLGYKQYELGSGLYGTVWARPEDNFVIKIFVPDEGYSNYLQYMQSNTQNPYVPKMRGKPVKLPNGFTLVRLEKLKRIDKDLYIQIRYFMKSNVDYDADMRKQRKEFEDKYPQFLNFMDELRVFAKNRGLSTDLHGGNIMMRGNLPVVTDPFMG